MNGRIGGAFFGAATPTFDNRDRLNAYSAFAEVYYQLSDRPKLTGGLRYTDERKYHSVLRGKAPHCELLQAMSLETVLAALETGVMRQQAASLTSRQRRQVAEYVTRTPHDERGVLIG